MAVTILITLRIAGVERSPGTVLSTLTASEEAELVSRGAASYVGDDPSIIPAVQTLLEAPAVAGRAMPMARQPLHIAQSSALDLSLLRRTAVPAGKNGRIQIHGSDATKLAEASAPTTEVRFFVATYAPDGSINPLPTNRETITAGIEHLAACGFNALRVHGIEYWMCSGSTTDFEFTAADLDLMDWMLAEAKRCGLYWIINPRQPELYQAGTSRFSMPVEAKNWKPRIFVQTDARTHYMTGFGRLYNRINPYTGLNILQDPALLQIEWFNECSAQQTAQAAWPQVWTTRESARGTAALTFNEWLADSAQAHGYANLAALNAAWGTAHASFTVIPAPASLPNLSLPLNEQSWAVVLYVMYLDDALADFFASYATTLGFTGLQSSIISFPNLVQLRAAARKSANSVVNLHDYTYLTPTPEVSAAIASSQPNAPVWEFASWMASAGGYTSGKPCYLGEYGMPYWGQYRNQYPMLAAFAAFQGACGVSLFHQGGFFEDEYSGIAGDRVRKMFPYEGHADPVVRFSQMVMFFAHHLGYVSEAAYTFTLTYNDRYYGVNPKNTGRIQRSFFKLFLPVQLVGLVAKLRMTWDSDTTDDTLSATYNAEDWFTRLDAIKTAGGVTADNLGYVSVSANRGTITAVATSGTVGGLTATVTQPILTIGTHSLVDNDYIAITNIAGSGGTWPGTNGRGTRAKVLVASSTQVQIISGLNLTGLTGFSAGTWCELDNVNQSGGKQLLLSRRAKVLAINTPNLKYFADGGASGIYPYTTGLTNIEIVSCTTGAAVFVASLDGAALNTSTDMLLGLVGSARNSGESYTTAANTTLATVGDWPIVMDEVSAVLKVARAAWGRFVLQALRLDGAVVAQSEVGSIGTSLVVALSNAPHGTIFFRLRSEVR